MRIPKKAPKNIWLNVSIGYGDFDFLFDCASRNRTIDTINDLKMLSKITAGNALRFTRLSLQITAGRLWEPMERISAELMELMIQPEEDSEQTR